MRRAQHIALVTAGLALAIGLPARADPTRAPPSLPRLRGQIGAFGGLLLPVGFRNAPYFGAGAAGSLGAQFTEVVGLDGELAGCTAGAATALRASVLVNATPAPWFTIAVGPTVATGFGPLLPPQSWFGTLTARASFRPSVVREPSGRRRGFTMDVWLDGGVTTGPTFGANCASDCRSTSAVFGGFLGLGYAWL